MSQKQTPFSAASRLLPFLAVAGFYGAAFLSGCGGGDGTVVPSPSPSGNVPGRGQGGALSDGCSRGGTLLPQPGWDARCGAPVQPKRKWTVLLYMNGANDLEEYGLLNLNQIEQYGSDANVTFVAQFKRIHSIQSTDDKSDGNWAGARRFVMRYDTDPNHVASPEIARREDIDMGDPATLQAFIQWGTQTFPADHYAIVLWNHGAGWRSKIPGGRAVTRGFSYDDEKGTHIDTIQLPAAIDMGGGRKWDLVAWDSSLMQMTEVAYEIRDKTNWIVGSEESPPGTGYPYDRWVNTLVSNPSGDGQFLGGAICDSMLAGYGSNSNITQSVLDASKMAPLAAAVNDFGASLLAAKGTNGAAIANARGLAEHYENPYDTNKDLLDVARLIKAGVGDARVQGAAAQVQAAANAAIVKSVHGDFHPNSQGIAIYMPSPNSYYHDDVNQADGFGQRYTELSFARDAPNWQAFLSQGPP